jgi:CelD/BcsL family acetyltransferase involved in cellulose biosynthesis
MRIKLVGENEQSARVQLISGRDLDPTLISCWQDICSANSDLQSPFFAPEFTRIISAVRDDVEIAVISTEAAIVAFLPFQRDKVDPSQGLPVGDFIQDWVGLICQPGFSCDPLELIRECKLMQFKLFKFLGSQVFFEPFHSSKEISAQMDLSRGYDAYLAEKRADGTDLFKSCANLARRIEREIGPLQFVAHSPDTEPLKWLFSRKSAQYMRTGLTDLFSIGWAREAIERIHSSRTVDFTGKLSLLYAGDRLLAGHLGMHSRTIWHYYIPTYDVEMSKYSPGLNLLLRIAAYAPSIGLHTIELGRNRAAYKARLMNKGVFIVDGSVRADLEHADTRA